MYYHWTVILLIEISALVLDGCSCKCYKQSQNQTYHSLIWSPLCIFNSPIFFLSLTKQNGTNLVFKGTKYLPKCIYDPSVYMTQIAGTIILGKLCTEIHIFLQSYRMYLMCRCILSCKIQPIEQQEWFTTMFSFWVWRNKNSAMTLAG